MTDDDNKLILLERVLGVKEEFVQLKDNKELRSMLQHFEQSIPESLGMAATELARITGVRFDKWAELLNLPPVNDFIQTQAEEHIRAASRAAAVHLGDAEKSVDVQKIKAFADMSKRNPAASRKPFKIYMHPIEVTRYKSALESIKTFLEADESDKAIEITNLIDKALGNANS